MLAFSFLFLVRLVQTCVERFDVFFFCSFSLATAGSDVSICGGLTRGLYAWAFDYDDDDDQDEGKIDLLVLGVMVCAAVQRSQVGMHEMNNEKFLRSLYIGACHVDVTGCGLEKKQSDGGSETG